MSAQSVKKCAFYSSIVALVGLITSSSYAEVQYFLGAYTGVGFRINSGPNLFGLATGIRTGILFSNLYIGLQWTHYFGTEYISHNFGIDQYQLETGYRFHWKQLQVRPYLGVGLQARYYSPILNKKNLYIDQRPNISFGTTITFHEDYFFFGIEPLFTHSGVAVEDRPWPFQKYTQNISVLWVTGVQF